MDSQDYGLGTQGEYDYFDNQVCPMCQGTSFAVTSGFLACTTCGHQADFQQTESQVPEASARGGWSQGLRRVRKPKKRPAHQVLLEEQLEQVADKASTVVSEAEEEATAHLKRLQELLWKQTACLTTLHHCHGSLRVVVKEIWFRLLHLNEDIAQLNETKKGAKVEPNREQQPVHELVALCKRIRKAFAFEKTIPILMLAALIVREPIMPVDLTKAILTAEMPLFEAGVHVRHGIVSMTSRVLLDSIKLSEQLMIPPPKVNVGGLVVRFLDELGLPMQIALHVHRLHAFLPGEEAGKCFEISSSTYRFADPYPFVFGLLVVTLKLLYGLDGRQIDRREEDSSLPPISWTGWAKELLQSKEDHHSLWLSENIVSMPKEDIRAYIDFLNKHLFSEEFNHDRHNLRSMYRKLKGIARQQKEASGGGGSKNAKTTANPSNSKRRDEEEEAAEEYERGSGDDDSSRPSSTGEAAFDKTSYVMCNEGCDFLHLDYQAVVLAISSTFWIKPSFVHHAVIRLERLMLQEEEARTSN
jgi:hypothetical protein